MRQYELTYLVSDNVHESDLTKVTGKVGGYIAEEGGKLLKEEIWKRRKLAYPIKKQEFATYVSLNFDMPKERANAFERHIKMTPEIIRHLMIVKEYGTEELSLTAEEIADTAAIEEAIGGENSFEAVEGETEASRDLMAKRKDDDEEQIEEKVEEQEKAEEKTEEPSQAEKTEGETKTFEAVAPARNASSTADASEEEKTVKDEEPSSEDAAEKKEVKKPRKKKEASSEADRLAKLDEELDNLLKDDL